MKIKIGKTTFQAGVYKNFWLGSNKRHGKLAWKLGANGFWRKHSSYISLLLGCLVFYAGHHTIWWKSEIVDLDEFKEKMKLKNNPK